MATQQAPSRGDPDYFSLDLQSHDSAALNLQPDDDNPLLIQQFPIPNMDTVKELKVPNHPIPSMQGAFAESMLEASETNTPTFPKSDALDAANRRRILLDQDVTEDTHAAKWKQKPGQRYHELWKLISQISFGIYLLLNGIALDDEQVLNILQGHVDEVDAFLEMTLDDFDLAQRDIDERLNFLKMPFDNIHIFDAMLEDRAFRLQIVTGNEQIEHIITRTAAAMNDSLKDVQQGLDATKEFAIYLAEEQDAAKWVVEKPEMQKVYEAMKGNAEGWCKAFVSLQTKGKHLEVALVQLGTIVAEMDKRAGEVSRKTRFSVVPGTHPGPSSPPTSPVISSPLSTSQKRSSTKQTKPANRHFSRASIASLMKNLPEDSDMISPAKQATRPAFKHASEREQTPEPEAEFESESESERDHEHVSDSTLAPRTYTPVPQNPPTPEPEQESAEEVRPRNSIRQRFSLKQKVVPEQRPAPVPTPVQSPTPMQSPQLRPPTNSSQRSKARVPTPVQSPSPIQSPQLRPPANSQRPKAPVATSPSARGPDSDRKGLTHASSQDLRRMKHTQSPALVPSPRSEQQQFHSVRGNPSSPLQRPWTAGPTNLRSHSASSANLSMTSSNMTTVTENGVKVKKKRSAFGWLKNAFALSEEERAEFERKKRGASSSTYAPQRRPQPRFVDGKRMR